MESEVLITVEVARVQISRKSAIDSLSYGQGKFSYFAVIVTEVSSL